MRYIFSFSSRNAAMRFCDAAQNFGLSAKLVNTPQSAGIGCGLSVKCDDYDACQGVLNRGHFAHLNAVYEFDGERYRLIYNG